MQMAGNISAPFDMAVHCQNFQTENFPADQCGVGDTCLLPQFPQSHRAQILLPVGVTAQPGPGIVDVVVSHQSFCAFFVYHPCGCGKMRNHVGTVQIIMAVGHELEHYLSVAGFLLIFGGVVLDILK